MQKEGEIIRFIIETRAVELWIDECSIVAYDKIKHENTWYCVLQNVEVKYLYEKTQNQMFELIEKYASEIIEYGINPFESPIYGRGTVFNLTTDKYDCTVTCYGKNYATVSVQSKITGRILDCPSIEIFEDAVFGKSKSKISTLGSHRVRHD